VGTVFRKTITKSLPAGAEIFTRKGERFARWKHKGKTRTAQLTLGKDGSDRLLLENPYFVAKYRNGAGLVEEVSTGCRDEQAARRVLADLERRAELVKAGVVTAAEDRVADHQATPLAEHLDAFDQYLAAKDASDIYRSYTRRYLDRLATECGFSILADLRREKLERWLAARAAEGVGAKARNHYRGALVAFCNWCVGTDRLTLNPFSPIPKANEKADRRRQRRAMEESELVKLLDVARRRPLLDRQMVRRGKRKGEAYARLRDTTHERLERLGRERALLYKTLVLTGLRKAELASLTVGQLFLDSPLPYIALNAADEKNREGNEIVLRDDLADDLRAWLAGKLATLQAEARKHGEPIPARLPGETPLFTVPAGLLRILNRDLRLAGIAKRDERGRTLDVHALRMTFGTLLSKGGVAPRTAQAAMRHSDIRLTMGVYTDPKLLDVRGALDALPPLPLGGTGVDLAEAMGTGGKASNANPSVCTPVCTNLVQTDAKGGNSGRVGEKEALEGGKRTLAVTSSGYKRKEPPTSRVSGCLESGREDLNLRPHGPEA
jgi:integrase